METGGEPMSAVVSLHEVVEELDVPVSECSTYLNRKTGEVVPSDGAAVFDGLYEYFRRKHR